ncbi:MAG TPA: STAS domain-containing protein [Acidimicrobiia bacterium]|nr:STAS domain-containing protein [Acidimicrobiia bacterium]
MEGFEATARAEGSTAVVDMAGLLDRSASAALDAAFSEALGLSAGPVVFNFGDVGYINSTGIAIVVGALARARAEGRDVRAYGLTEHYREIFSITRLSDFMGIYDDETTAVAG